jgi:hypothetical protein
MNRTAVMQKKDATGVASRKKNRSKFSQLIFLVVGLCIIGFVSFTYNYGARKAFAEYRLKDDAVQWLDNAGQSEKEYLPTIIGIAHKESRFWDGAEGRHHEVGTMQLSEALAREHGLKVSASVRSSPIAKLLSIHPSEEDISTDQRFDERINMQVALDHFMKMEKKYREEYSLDENSARDLAMLAFEYGDERTQDLVKTARSTELTQLLHALADPNLPEESWFDRAVAVSFCDHVLGFRVKYAARLPAVLSKHRPGVSEILAYVLSTPGEFHTRLFKDIPELHRAMNAHR